MFIATATAGLKAAPEMAPTLLDPHTTIQHTTHAPIRPLFVISNYTNTRKSSANVYINSAKKA